MDLIERQAAIDAIKTWGLIDGLSEGEAIEILADEEKVPSAQPDRELIEQLKWERDTAIQQLKDLGYGLGEKVRTEMSSANWIPCSERLPEESGEYLCMLVGVHNTGMPSECGYEPPNNHGITSGWSTCEADGFKFLRDDEVIAWMPLPEPYKGEQDG